MPIKVKDIRSLPKYLKVMVKVEFNSTDPSFLTTLHFEKIESKIIGKESRKRESVYSIPLSSDFVDHIKIGGEYSAYNTFKKFEEIYNGIIGMEYYEDNCLRFKITTFG